MKKIAYIELDTHAEIVKDFSNYIKNSENIRCDFYLSKKIIDIVCDIDNMYLTSPKTIVDDLDNIDYDVVEQSLIRVPYSEKYGMVAVNTLLRILMAYDRTTNPGSLSNVVEKYYRKISGNLCSTALPCFVIEHIEDAATEVFKVPESIADTL